MDNEKIIGLLEAILAELQMLNSHAVRGRQNAESIQKKQQAQAEKMVSAIKGHLPAGMAKIAESMLGGAQNGE